MWREIVPFLKADLSILITISSISVGLEVVLGKLLISGRLKSLYIRTLETIFLTKFAFIIQHSYHR